MKRLLIIIGVLIVLISVLKFISPTLSSGSISQISGAKGSRTVQFIDTDTNEVLDYDTAMKYYGIPQYYSEVLNNETIYFKDGKEIKKDEFEKGYYDEQANIRKRDLGSIAYRVKTTSEVKKVVDNLFNNYMIGKYYLEYSPYDDIDWKNVNNYLYNKYHTSSAYQNYYKYDVKGIFEPFRFFDVLEKTYQDYEYTIDTTTIRITKDQKQVVDNFMNNLLPLLKGDGSDYQKILAAYTYITNTVSYLPDETYVTDALKGNTSIYAVFINRKSVCTGYSIGFSYLMDRFGIESYIVDDIVYVDEVNKQSTSVHTFNIVKLDNKWYKVDPTGGIFLAGINQSELFDNKLNISTTAYNTSGKSTKYNIDYNKVNTYLANAKKLKTTTTKYVITTTKEVTRKTTKATTTKEKITNSNNTTTNSTTTNDVSTTSTYITYSYSTTEKSSVLATTKNINDSDPKTNDNDQMFMVKVLLGVISGITVVLLIIYEIKYKKESINK